MVKLQDQFLVGIFLLELLLYGIESLDFCFNASLEGFRLNSFVLKKTDVSSKINCILSCVQEPCCRSLNYRERLPQGQTSLCEMLHDVIYNTSAELQKNRFYDYVYLNAPIKEYNGSCIDEKVKAANPGNFDLNFPSKSVDSFILHDNNVPEMSNITLLFWINTLDAEEMTVLSYAVDENDKEFTLAVMREKIILRVQSSEKHFYVPPINDGYWHHVGAWWSLGEYAIFLDSTLVYSGDHLGSMVPLKAGGIFVIGQKLQSTTGTFNSSFSGKLSQLSVWRDFHSSVADLARKFTNRNCSNNAFGDIINWSSLKHSYSGMIVKEQPSLCKPLRKNPNYDITVSVNSYLKDVKLENITSLRAFTIATWIKCEARSLETQSVKFFEYTISAGEIRLLSFNLGMEILTLEINGEKIREARIPWFWNESPAYWHHIATSWSNDTGHWTIYLDGSLVSIMHDVVSHITIPAGGQLLLDGYTNGSSQSRLNIWNYEIDGHVLSLMANKGPLFENGNVLAWYEIKSKFEPGIDFQETPSDLRNSRAEAVYQMDFFSEKSVENYVRIENIFKDKITVFSACFWARFFAPESSLLAYSSATQNSEFGVYFYRNFALGLVIAGKWDHTRPVISAYDSWHFYCIQWRSEGGLIEIYKDGKLLGTSYETANAYWIPPNGIMVLGQEMDSHGGTFQSSQAFKGSLAGLNLWRQFLTANIIQGMASGIMNVNGDLFQWRDFRIHLFGSVAIRNGSEAEIPEYRVQNLRDKWCVSKAFTFARFIRGQDKDGGYKWRCVDPAAMLDENMCYDIAKNSSLTYTTDMIQLLQIN
ncbi:uncharacterized protein LOC114530936 [Dendronephthya gigantea]|uniref:uncharacterized protein LOC114530936 n=1 Tax=Dendronephthya gigantea TaxID=151771 RepID=UPI0010692FDD|nr:uncharacterized protein LOC114530936 [Dendronephthya gigantea]